MCHVCAKKPGVFNAVFRCPARSHSYFRVYSSTMQNLCVSAVGGSTWEREGFLNTGPLTGKHFIGCLRILMTSADRLDFGFTPITPPHELPTPAAIKPTACLECRTWLLQHTSHTGQKTLRLRIFFYIDWSHFDPILPSVTIKETRVALHARCSDVHPDPERYGMLNDS